MDRQREGEGEEEERKKKESKRERGVEVVINDLLYNLEAHNMEEQMYKYHFF